MDLFRIVAVGFLDPAHSESLRDSLACFIAIWLLVKILTMFPRQRWSEVRITAAHLSQHRLAKLLGVSSVGDAPEVASAAGLAHLRRDTAPTPACLADSSAPETPPRLRLQAVRLQPSHDVDTTQLFSAQSPSPQSECLLSKAF